MYGLREHVEAGGLMSYGQSRVANYRRAAYFVDKILSGAQAADLPVGFERSESGRGVVSSRTPRAEVGRRN